MDLTSCTHDAPSFIDHATLSNFRDLPIAFLLGCGFQDWQIEAAKLLRKDLSPSEITEISYRVHDLRTTSPIVVTNLFISYSHADNEFVNHLGRTFEARRIRYWRDVQDATAGPLEKIVVRAMHDNPTVLMILSKNSTNSDWVEFEAEKARELEKKLDRHVLCPIALDDSWKTCKWSAVLRNQIVKYNILPFHDWSNPADFEDKFNRLLKGLHVYYATDKTDPASR
jgi:hypothetical protein